MDPFDADFLTRLEQLKLAVARRATGLREGDLAARRPGPSEDVLTHRPYSPGDDPRHVDWNISARLSQVIVKQFVARRTEEVAILVDSSASMAPKWKAAAQLAVALAVVGRASHAKVEVRRLPGGSWTDGEWPALLELLRIPAAGRYAPPPASRGTIIYISDFWDTPPVILGNFAFIRVLSAHEANPRVLGPVRLRDSETGREISRVLDEAEVRQYQGLLSAGEAELRAACVEAGGAWARITDDQPIGEAVWVALREAGVLE